MNTLFFACLRAFLVGGTLCALAEYLIDRTNLTPARIMVLYVVSGVFLGAVGWFRPLADFAGGGVTVPIVGFGGTIARGVREAVDRDGLIGVLTGPLTAAAGGTTAALLCGFLVAVFFRSHPKRTF